MADRRFTEVDLLRMLAYATSFKRDIVKGRWVISSRHPRRPGQKSYRTMLVDLTLACRVREQKMPA